MTILHACVPTLWRYFLGQYCKALGISLFGFIVILFSTRLEDVARLISLGASLSPILLYLLYQIPYVLQLALPISSLIASLFLFQRLSSNNELTAIRAAGISMYQLLTPILLFALLVASLFFYFLFDVSAHVHLAAKRLEFTIKSQYPLALLQNSRVLERSGITLDMKGSLKNDGEAQDLVMAIPGSNGKPMLLVAKKVWAREEQLQGQDMSLISTSGAKEEGTFDHLIIENAATNSLELKNLGAAAIQRSWKANNEILTLPLLLAKRQDLSQTIAAKAFKEKKAKKTKRLLDRCTVELVRRFSLALSIITFSLLGVVFGSSIGRRNSRKRLSITVAFSALFLVSYLAAKAIEHKTAAAILLYLTPHLILMIAIAIRLQKIQQGMEDT